MAVIDMLTGGLIGAMIGAAVATMVFGAIALYIYFAFVFSTLANKMKHKDIAWLAWVPIANLALIPILAKKKWPWVFIFLVPFANIVFFIIWTWKIYEFRKYPGWLALLPVLFFFPVLGFIAGIGELVMWGIVAWRD
ncbi:MAG: hypothetical protein WC916_03135 [Candidatus Woesearchaeota archaeon]